MGADAHLIEVFREGESTGLELTSEQRHRSLLVKDVFDSELHLVIAAEFERWGLVERDKRGLREAVAPNRKRRTIEDIGRG